MTIKSLLNSLIHNFRHSRLGSLVLAPEEVGGIDISPEGLKLAFFHTNGNKIEWEHYSSRPLPSGVIVDGKVKDPDVLAANIRQLFEAIVSDKKLSREFVVSIPESNVYVDMVQIPASINDSLVLSIIMNNSAASLPFPPGELYLSWQEVSKEGVQRRVILAYAKKSIVDGYQRAFESTGLNPIVLQTPSLGYKFSADFSKGIDIVYFLEDKIFTVAAYLEGGLFYKRTVRYKDALPAKTRLSLESVAELIAKDFIRTKDFALTELGEDHRVNLMLYSFLPNIDQIEDFLKKKNLPVVPMSVRKTEVPKNISQPDSWTALIGAAIRGVLPRKDDSYVSVLPFSTREQYFIRKRALFFSRAIKIIFTTVLFYIFVFAAIGFFLSSEQKKVTAEYNRQQEIKVPVEFSEIEKEKEAFNTAVSKIGKIQNSLVSLIPSLKTMNRLIRPGISISAFQMSILEKGISVTITGVAETREKFLEFKKYLVEELKVKDMKTPPQSLEQRQNIAFSITYLYEI